MLKRRRTAVSTEPVRRAASYHKSCMDQTTGSHFSLIYDFMIRWQYLEVTNQQGFQDLDLRLHSLHCQLVMPRFCVRLGYTVSDVDAHTSLSPFVLLEMTVRLCE